MRRPACLLTASALFAVLALAGCVWTPQPAPPATPAVPPVAAPTASPQEALRLEAAHEYTGFVLTLNNLERRGPIDPAMLSTVTTPAFAEELATSLGALRADGLRFDGAPAVTDVMLLEPADPDAPVAQVCADTSSMTMVDVETGEASPLDATAFDEMYVSFERSELGALLVSGRAPVPEHSRVCP